MRKRAQIQTTTPSLPRCGKPRARGAGINPCSLRAAEFLIRRPGTLGHRTSASFNVPSLFASPISAFELASTVFEHTQNTLHFTPKTQESDTLISQENTEKHTETHLFGPPSPLKRGQW